MNDGGGTYNNNAVNDRGNWSDTFMGGQYFPIDPSPSEVHIEDIAQSLGLQCRYNGHCQFFYSVAEHSVLVSMMAETAGMDLDRQLWGLLHDAAEAYVTDIPRPLKPYLKEHMEIEDRNMKVIASRFQLSWPMPMEIKELDTLILLAEREQVMSKTDYDWHLPDLPTPSVKIVGYIPAVAPKVFMNRFKQLMERRAA